MQNEDGLARKAPMTRTLRINVDVAAAKVKILEDVRDAIGNTDRQMHDYGGIHNNDCKTFDHDNWQCRSTAVDRRAPSIRVEMRNGEHRDDYFGTHREYTRQARQVIP